MGELYQVSDVPVISVPDSPVSPICTGLCWSLSFRRRVLAALAQSTALRHLALLLGRLCPASFSGTMLTMLFFRNPMHVAEAPDAPPCAADEVRVGEPPPDVLPHSARENNKNLRCRHHTTMLPTAVDILRAPADDSPNPPTRADRLVLHVLVREQRQLTRRARHPRKTTNLLLVRGRSSRFFPTSIIALLSAFWPAGGDSSGSITRSA